MRTVICAMAAWVLSEFAMADAIFIKPGQCIVVGTQQVCAIKEDGPATPTINQNRALTICKFGSYDSEEPKTKGYALFLVQVKEDGSKTETLIKSFGPAGKADCEKETKNYK
ncbi:MAG: hypothetical protein AB7T49_18215 [Oligoflexales bacterium]